LAYCTRGQVKQRYQSILDDYPQTATSPYTENVFAPAFGEAYDVLFSSFLSAQGAVIELIQQVNVPAFVTQMAPADMGILNMGEPIFLRERILGSNEHYKTMHPVDVLAQRMPSTYLREYNWRNNTFYFIGATNLIDLEVKYECSSVAPTDDAASIPVDSCLNFLANYCVGVSGGRKGDDATASRCMNIAVGPKYNQGIIGGQLYMLVQPSVRNRQNVQISHRPYTTWGRPFSRWGAVPYVAAQQGTTGGGANNVPVQFSSALGSVIGNIDGSNTTFWVNAGNVVAMVISVNGVVQTVGLDVSYVSNQFTFTSLRIPQPGDIITVEAFMANAINYGSAVVAPPTQYVPACGKGAVHPTWYELSSATSGIVGPVDGTNQIYFLNIGQILDVTLFLNGIEQTVGLDYSLSVNQITFLLYAPQPGDVITAKVLAVPHAQ
jgi:hypothetical protein